MARPVEFNLEKAVTKIEDHIEKNPKNIQHVKSVAHICGFLGICRDTWYRHIKKNNDAALSDTIKRIEDLQEIWWVDAGLSGKVNATSWIFCLKNLRNWRDKKEVDIGNKEGSTFKLAYSVNDD